MEPVRMYHQAVTFKLAAERCREQRIKEDGTIQMLIVPDIVNAAFACEIFLKTILEKTGKSSEKQHKLDKLFGLLESGDREKIKCKCGDKDSFDENIKKIGNTFVQWRYFYECESGNLNLEFLYQLTEVLDEVTKEIILKSNEGA